jgi:hypothetical protein
MRAGAAVVAEVSPSAPSTATSMIAAATLVAATLPAVALAQGRAVSVHSRNSVKLLLKRGLVDCELRLILLA